MGPRARVLRVSLPENGGPRKRRILEGYAEMHGAKDGRALIGEMIAAGELELYGSKRGARWGLPDGASQE